MVAGSPAVPRALLWDVDGTLAETEQQGHRLAFNRAFEEAGLPWHWDPPTYHRLLAVSGGRERIAFYLGELKAEPPEPALLKTLLARKQVHYRDILANGRLSLRPGVARLIGEAAAAGVPQAIVTTSSEEAVQALADNVLGEWRDGFAFRICGEDVAMKKPHPEAYRLALARLGFGPEGVVAIEDSSSGLRAARTAGLTCLVTLSSLSVHEPPSAFNGAAAVVENLGDEVTALRLRQGPPCPGGLVTLSYLGCLLDPS